MGKTENREMRISRRFKAPITLMWEVWTNAEHIAKWWGPDGFTSTIHEMNVALEGEWRLTLHAPDGTNYPNRSIYREIVPMKKLVYEHFNPHFVATILFEAIGEETQLEWIMEFDTSEMRDTVVKVHKADIGLKQNVDKLEKYLQNRV